jgi:hypothetical protein
VTFTTMERIERVRNENTNPYTVLSEVTYDEIGRETFTTSDTPTKYAIKTATDTTVTIRMDKKASTAYNIIADGLATVATLSGSTAPSFPESFHDILIEGVVADELRRMEKAELAAQSEAIFEQRLADLKAFVTKATDVHQMKKRIPE